MSRESPKATQRRSGSDDHPLRVAIVNDYEVIVAGVSAMLAPHRQRVAVVELDVREDPDHGVDVALFDTYGQPGLGLDRVRSLAESERVGAVAVYTWSFTKASRTAVFKAGAQGLIAKALPADKLVEALEGVAAGQVIDTGGFRGGAQGGPWPGTQWGLSARESETLALLATGMSNRAIAEALVVSENTVRTHIKAVFRKLAITNRTQLRRWREHWLTRAFWPDVQTPTLPTRHHVAFYAVGQVKQARSPEVRSLSG